MKVPRRSPWRQCYWWMLTTAGSLLVGIVIAATLAQISNFRELFFSLNSAYDFALYRGLLFASAGIIIGMTVGFGQWLLLHAWIRGAGRWILVTTIGLGLGSTVGQMVLSSILMPCSPGTYVGVDRSVCFNIPLITLLYALCGAIGGATIGIAQWVILRKRVRHAGWWIPANLIGWATGVVLGGWGPRAIENAFHIYIHCDFWPPLTDMFFVDHELGFPIMAIAIAVFTGPTLARLLDRTNDDESIPSVGQI